MSNSYEILVSSIGGHITQSLPNLHSAQQVLSNMYTGEYTQTDIEYMIFSTLRIASIEINRQTEEKDIHVLEDFIF